MQPVESDLPKRPESDRPLDAEIALRALREQFPTEVFAHATPLPSGWASDPYVIDDELVAHFPRNAELAEWGDRDETILAFVQSALGAAFRVPRVVHRGNPGEHFPHAFLVCDFIPGVPFSCVDGPVSSELAAELGAALTYIHSVPAASAAQAGVTVPEWDTYRGPLSFLHGDFGPDNIIVDPSTGRLAGIIDWGNAQLGDRVRDFHNLVLNCGWAFTNQVLEAYGVPHGDDFMDRLRSCARTEAAQWLLDSVRRGLDTTLNLVWVRNAFSAEDRA